MFCSIASNSSGGCGHNVGAVPCACPDSSFTPASKGRHKAHRLQCLPEMDEHEAGGDRALPLRYLNSYYRENNIAEAMRLYEHAYQIGIGYGREGTGNRLGDMYLVSRNLIQAEAYFNKALDVGQHYGFKRRLYAKYG